MTLSTSVFTAVRLINASIKGAIGGAKDAITLEKQFMAWESELETLEVFDGYQGWIEVADDDIPVSHQQQDECMNCYNSNQDEIIADFLSDENQTEIFCKQGFGCNKQELSHQEDCINCDNKAITHGLCEVCWSHNAYLYEEDELETAYEASIDELGDGVREEDFTHECANYSTSNKELEDRGFFVPKAFDVDQFNDDFHGELYFMDTLKNCRCCGGEIYANHTDAICDCNLPF